MSLSRLGYLAVKRETTLATAVKPTKFIRFKDGDILASQEIIANNPIQNNRWNALNAVAGKVTAEWTYNFDLDFNESVHFISVALGWISSADVSSATDGSVYTHTITVTNSLPGLTIEQGKWNLDDTSNHRQNYQVDRAFGAMVDSFTLSGSDGILNLAIAMKAHGVLQKRNLISNAAAGSNVVLQLDSSEGLTTGDTVNIYDATPQSEQDAIAAISLTNRTITIASLWNSYTVANLGKVELVPQTPSYWIPAKVASFIHARFQFWSDLTAAASATLENIEDREFEYQNNLEERFGSLRSSPSVIAPKGAKATMKFTKYFENVADRDRYLNQTKRAWILTITNNEIVSATDTGSKKYTLKIEMSDVRFTMYEMPTGTDELYAASVEAECYYDSTDWQAVRIIATNKNAWTVYTA